jgi:2,4-dienoyl-CoA reductase-like NADH-dependent reductase (Old Yellow Enzyme family)
MKTANIEKSMQVKLFESLTIKSITLRNRIGVSPMCQYSSLDGFANDWHLVHLGSRAIGGAGLVMTEAAAVEPIGRIAPEDLGIYKDEHIGMLKKITDFIHSFGAVAGMQIAHAGRKASTYSPLVQGSRSTRDNVPLNEGGWETVAPSAIPFIDNYRAPKELTIEEIKEIQNKFRLAAKRALQAGFKWLELHAAHGYLLHSFYSPLSNQRKDIYGGSFENRIRMVVETVREINKEWPKDLPFAVRLSCSDWTEGGWTIEDSIKLAKILKQEGVDLIDCSSGFVIPGVKYPNAPGFQVPFAEQIRKVANIATAAVGMITEPEQASQIINDGKADIVMLARAEIRDPYWPFHTANALGTKDVETLPKKYTYAI